MTLQGYSYTTHKIHGNIANLQSVQGRIFPPVSGGSHTETDHEVVTVTYNTIETAQFVYQQTVSRYYKKSEYPIKFRTTRSTLADWVIRGTEDGVGDYTGSNLYDGTLEQGRIYDDSGELDTSETRIRSNGYFATLQAGTYKFNATKSSSADSASMRACLYAYDNSGNYIGYFPSGWETFPFQVSLPAAKYKILISYTDNGSIEPSHVSDILCVPAGVDAPTITNGYSIPINVHGKNLFDKSNYQIVRLYPKSDDGAGGRATSESVSWSIVMPCKPSTDYVFSMYSPTSETYRNRMNIGGYEVYPVNGTDATIFDNTNTRDGDYLYNAFTTDSNTNYLLIFLWSDSSYTEQVVQNVIDIAELQLEEGTERTAYEGYYNSDVTITLNHPLGSSDSISFAETEVSIPTSSTVLNILSVGTDNQPDEMYIKY